MLMLYNSENYAVVQIDLPATEAVGDVEGTPARGGYEIVDKFARKEIFLEGEMAATFRDGVQALIDTDPSEDDIDEFIGRFSSLMQHPVVLH
jgi:hypothetical protein